MCKFDYSPRNIGIYGEMVVQQHLLSKGHEIIAQNLRLKSGEIDILTFKNKDIYIIEVKSMCIFVDKSTAGGHGTHGYTHQRDIAFRAEDNLSKTKIHKLNRLRRELQYRMDSGHFLTYEFNNLDSDANIIIEGITVDIYYDLAKSAVVRITLRRFPFL
jgi:hypothetical protein